MSQETMMILVENGKEVLLKVKEDKLYSCGYIPQKKGRVLGFDFPAFKGTLHFEKKVELGQQCQTPQSTSHASLAYLGEYDSLDDIQQDFARLESSDLVVYGD